MAMDRTQPLPGEPFTLNAVRVPMATNLNTLAYVAEWPTVPLQEERAGCFVAHGAAASAPFMFPAGDLARELWRCDSVYFHTMHGHGHLCTNAGDPVEYVDLCEYKDLLKVSVLVETMFKSLGWYVRTYGVTTLTIVGHSYGTYLSSRLVQRMGPEMRQRLNVRVLLLATQPTRPIFHTHGLLGMLVHPFNHGSGMSVLERLVDRVFMGQYRPHEQVTPQEFAEAHPGLVTSLARWYHKYHYEAEGRPMVQSLNSALIMHLVDHMEWFTEADWQALHGTCLVVCGREDKTIKPPYDDPDQFGQWFRDQTGVDALLVAGDHAIMYTAYDQVRECAKYVRDTIVNL